MLNHSVCTLARLVEMANCPAQTSKHGFVFSLGYQTVASRPVPLVWNRSYFFRLWEKYRAWDAVRIGVKLQEMRATAVSRLVPPANSHNECV